MKTGWADLNQTWDNDSMDHEDIIYRVTRASRDLRSGPSCVTRIFGRRERAGAG